MKTRERSVRPSMRAAALALAVTAGMAGSAAARGDLCSVYRPGVPDFDQKRSSLPNDGKMYCVPASWINWMGFLQNNGYDGLLSPIFGTQNWQSQSHYSTVSARILEMGNRMDTDPFDGTSLDIGDVTDYINDHTSPNPYMITLGISVYPGSDMIGPTPQQAVAHLLLGGMVNYHISWFKREGNHFERHGGHSVSMNGATNLCGGLPILKWRDPGSNDSLSSQSTFTTSSSTMKPVFDVFSWADDSTNYYAMVWQFEGYTGNTKGFFTGLRTVMLNFGVGIHTTTNQITIVHPYNFLREEAMAPVTINVGDDKVLDLQLTADMTSALALTGGDKPRVWMLDLARGEHKPFFEPSKPGPLALGRFGDIFYCDGSVLQGIDPATGKAIIAVNVGKPLTHMVYDDGRDELVGIEPGARRLEQFDRELKIVGDRPLPDGVNPTSAASIAIHPLTRELWISMGDGSVFEITRPREGNPTARKMVLPGVDKCESLQFLPDGAFTVLCDGSVRQFRLDKEGTPQAARDSAFAGEKFTGLLRLGQSRDNTPQAWRGVREPDVQPPAEAPEEVIDCVGDYDGSGFVDTDDFTAFVLDFEAGVLRSDVDFSGFVDTDDFTYFVRAFEQGC